MGRDITYVALTVCLLTTLNLLLFGLAAFDPSSIAKHKITVVDPVMEHNNVFAKSSINQMFGKLFSDYSWLPFLDIVGDDIEFYQWTDGWLRKYGMNRNNVRALRSQAPSNKDKPVAIPTSVTTPFDDSVTDDPIRDSVITTKMHKTSLESLHGSRETTVITNKKSIKPTNTQSETNSMSNQNVGSIFIKLLDVNGDSRIVIKLEAKEANQESTETTTSTTNNSEFTTQDDNVNTELTNNEVISTDSLYVTTAKDIIVNEEKLTSAPNKEMSTNITASEDEALPEELKIFTTEPIILYSTSNKDLEHSPSITII